MIVTYRLFQTHFCDERLPQNLSRFQNLEIFAITTTMCSADLGCSFRSDVSCFELAKRFIAHCPPLSRVIFGVDVDVGASATRLIGRSYERSNDGEIERLDPFDSTLIETIF